MRLAPYDEATWELPPQSFNFAHTTIIEGESYDQHLHVQLELTASGSTLLSEGLKLGSKHETFMIHTSIACDQHLVELLEDTRLSQIEGIRMTGLYEWL
jgi:hypothetical protein